MSRCSYVYLFTYLDRIGKSDISRLNHLPRERIAGTYKDTFNSTDMMDETP